MEAKQEWGTCISSTEGMNKIMDAARIVSVYGGNPEDVLLGAAAAMHAFCTEMSGNGGDAQMAVTKIMGMHVEAADKYGRI